MGQFATENLTPAGKPAGYSDGEIFRVLQHGVDQSGHALGMMSSLPYRELSDDDLLAPVAYLRSQPPAESTGPTGDRPSFVGLLMVGAGMQPSEPPVEGVITAPPRGQTAEYGRYVATVGECRGCHGPDMTGTPAIALGTALAAVEPMAVAGMGGVLAIHRAFTLLFVSSAFLIAGVSAGVVGLGLRQPCLAGALFWQVGLAAAAGFLWVDLFMETAGWLVGAPGAAERATMLTVLFAGNLGAALAGGTGKWAAACPPAARLVAAGTDGLQSGYGVRGRRRTVSRRPGQCLLSA